MLFLPFGLLAWWAVPLAVAVVALGMVVVIHRAETFGDLVESAFDLHRWALYRALRWPLPSNPEEEYLYGTQLTEYLWRGSREPTPTFTKEP
jgi:hypothetical protein